MTAAMQHANAQTLLSANVKTAKQANEQPCFVANTKTRKHISGKTGFLSNGQTVKRSYDQRSKPANGQTGFDEAAGWVKTGLPAKAKTQQRENGQPSGKG
jgi:hypothetical protein